MDKLLTSRIIQAARTGKLTEEEYEIYLRLLDEDPEFEQDVKWEKFLEKYLPASLDADLYEAASKGKQLPKRPALWQKYAVAAALTLALLSGWIVFQYMFGKDQRVLLSTGKIELFNGDSRQNSQLGYTDGGLAIDEKTIEFWQMNDQKEKINYQFCSDTLKLYFNNISDTTGFRKDYRLTYFSDKQSFYFVLKENTLFKLTPCSGQPQPLFR